MKTADMYGHIFLGDIVELDKRPGEYAIVVRITPDVRLAQFRLIFVTRRDKTVISRPDRMPFNVSYKFMAEQTRTLDEDERQLLLAEIALAGIYYADILERYA